MKCERCKQEFNIEEARNDFESETLKCYDYLTLKLCANCAIDSINSLEDGMYFEICERCGKKYDPIVDESKFKSMHTNDYGTYASISDLTNELLCLDCALDEYNK